MQDIHKNSLISTSGPMSILEKLSAVALFSSAMLTCLLAFRIGWPDNLPLLIITAVMLLFSAFVALKLRWTLLLGILISAFVFIVMCTQVDVEYHMMHPREDFVMFVLDTLLFALLLTTFLVTSCAVLQHIRKQGKGTPRWLISTLSSVLGMVIGVLLIGIIAQPAAAGATSTSGEQTVHMGPGSFLQSSVTVAKGSKLQLVDDGAFLHVLSNGSWQGGQPVTVHEPNAPLLSNRQVNGNTIEIGPFTTAGTYHLYCSLHAGMTLTVIVQ